jgi:hypothetical protein
METNQDSINYRIYVQGHLDPRRTRWFEGLTVSPLPNGETVISGPIVDQAALYGVLNRIRDLGLPLLLVKRDDFQWEESIQIEN